MATRTLMALTQWELPQYPTQDSRNPPDSENIKTATCECSSIVAKVSGYLLGFQILKKTLQNKKT